MKYTNLGNTSIRVSKICFGCMSFGDKTWRDWVLDESQAKDFFQTALEQGINFFDTADVYSNGVSESITGRYLREMVSDREDVIIATKFMGGTHDRRRNRFGGSRRNIIASCEASLRRLGTDYIDLYQIHRFDSYSPIEETMRALDDLVTSGKVRYLGASSMYAWQFAKMQQIAASSGFHKFVTMQNHYNLLYREEEREMIPLCNDQNVGLIPWSPLARGYLSANRWKDNNVSVRQNSDSFLIYHADADEAVAQSNVDVAMSIGCTPSQSALAWLLSKKQVSSPIVGATKLNHLVEAIQAVDITLSSEHIQQLEAHYKPHPILGH